MKKIVIPVATSLALVACAPPEPISLMNKKKGEKVQITVPEVDGLSLIQPKLDSFITNISEEREKAKAEALERAKQIQELEESITTLEKEIEEIDQAISNDNEAKVTKEELLNSLKSNFNRINARIHFIKENSEALTEYLKVERERDSGNHSLDYNIENFNDGLKWRTERVNQLLQQQSSLDWIDSISDWWSGEREEREKSIASIRENIEYLEKKLEEFKQSKEVKNRQWEERLAELQAIIDEEGINEEVQKLQAELESSKSTKFDITEVELQIMQLENDILSKTNEKIAKENSVAPLKQSIADLKEADSATTNVVATKLEAAKLALAKRLVDGEKLKARDLIDVILLQNIKSDTTTGFDLTRLKEELMELAANSVSLSGDAGEFKVNYENEISKKHSGEALVYNSNFYQIQDPLEDNRVQCYSGSNLHLILNEMQDIPMKNRVVIYTRGHVLPGYIIAHGDRLFLMGVETTAAGKAAVSYGPTSEIGGEIRVFDAHQAMLLDIFKDDIDNLQDVIHQMLETMKTYGFNPEQFKPFTFTPASANGERQLNSSILGFGTSGETGTDKERSDFDHAANTSFKVTSEETHEQDPTDEDSINEEPTYEESSIEEGLIPEDVDPFASGPEEGGKVYGIIQDSVSGQAIANARIELKKRGGDSEAFYSMNTGPNGEYDSSYLLPGTYFINVIKDGYIEVMNFKVRIFAEEATRKNFILSEPLLGGRYRITLDWAGDKPGAVEDVDTYLKIPEVDQALNYYLKARMYNGAFLDRDDRSGAGPETLTIHEVRQGTYIYYVKNYSSGNDYRALGNSEISVTIYDRDNVLMTLSVPPGSGVVYEVFRIVDGEIVPTQKYNDTLR